ncbi:hypothetical protein EPA93_36065 [Ktedonosporobacter rubrisoli]|uniref:Uncharacterized protein n=1 Tax=Ktedonosporobacter rubrisoli TaxID=2509675 RepID=A0A4P6K0F0_KTERU|nr:hypothetical protein [Ktedonosporobacter rubrisoli]QBD81100.1 hypothetical protein EPA93_36065 [Ktedonosporobacter rubrisoli]
MNMQSEIAQLLQQIEDECVALQRALEGFAITASHSTINRCYQQLGATQEQLTRLVGEQESSDLLYERYQKTLG